MTGVSCTCVYNQSGRCKHVAALIYFINNYESLSKTNFEQQWGKPTPKQFAKEKYSKGSNFYEMFPPKPYLEMDLRVPNPDDLTFRSSLKIMLSAEQEACHEQVNDVVSLLVEKVDENIRIQDCQICVLNIHNFVEDHMVYSSKLIVLSDSIKLFYDSHIRISNEDIISLCSETIDQSTSSKWQLARSCRFSASTTVHKIKVRKTKTIESLLEELFFPKQCNLPAMQYGKKNESVARRLYETMLNKQVKEVGVIVSKDQPWLCASPDGIVVEDGCIVGLVEIKCPSSCEKLPIVDLVNKKCNVPYLGILGNEIILKKSNVYYTQCQVQMYVCGLNLCDLFIYSPLENGSCIISVHRDESFIEEVILKSEDFYFTHFLPILYSKTKEENEKNKCIKSKI